MNHPETIYARFRKRYYNYNMKKKMLNKCYKPSRKDSSVHYGSIFRFEKAKEQAKLKK